MPDIHDFILAVSPEEAAGRILTKERFDHCLKLLDEYGIVVLTGAIEEPHLDILADRVFADVSALLKNGHGQVRSNGHAKFLLPTFDPFLFEDILLNDIVIAITRKILGEGLYNDIYFANVNLPRSLEQGLHVDMGHLWIDSGYQLPPQAFSIQIPLIEMTSLNGATEFWPGSHKFRTNSIHDSIAVPMAEAKEKEKQSPPILLTVPRGSIIIRDLRTWHRGMPNLSSEVRPMITMIHRAMWLRQEKSVQIPPESSAFFKHPILRTMLDVVPKTELTYLRSPSVATEGTVNKLIDYQRPLPYA